MAGPVGKRGRPAGSREAAKVKRDPQIWDRVEWWWVSGLSRRKAFRRVMIAMKNGRLAGPVIGEKAIEKAYRGEEARFKAEIERAYVKAGAGWQFARDWADLEAFARNAQAFTAWEKRHFERDDELPELK